MTRRGATKAEVLGPTPTRSAYGNQLETVLELRKEMEETYDRHPGDMLSIAFSYEASNAFGEPLRSTAMCTYHAIISGDRIKISTHRTMIDGQTNLGWYTDRMSNQ